VRGATNGADGREPTPLAATAPRSRRLTHRAEPFSNQEEFTILLPICTRRLTAVERFCNTEVLKSLLPICSHP
jgi:hypothetical protein